jgi:DegV family protein with EDD domain
LTNVHVITDSDSNLPIPLAKKYGIQQVPIMIQFGEESFADGIEIDNKVLFEKIDRTGKLPTTAAPSPAAFTAAFETAFKTGADSVICVTVSSKISRTYESALVAANEMPVRKISVIDSESLSMAQSFIAIAAAEAVSKGSSHEEAVEAARSLIPRLYLYGSLSTLKYLALGGRVSNLAAGMANMLSIRPILCTRDGKLDLLEKVRTHKAAMDRLVVLLTTAVGNRPIERATILHTNNLEDAHILERALREKLTLPADFSIEVFGPGLSVHTGAGLVGCALLVKE